MLSENERRELHIILDNLPNAADEILKALDKGYLYPYTYWNGKCGCLIGVSLKSEKKASDFSRDNNLFHIENWLFDAKDRDKVLREEICCWRQQREPAK